MDNPIVVNANPASAVSVMLARQAALVVGGAVAAVALVKHHDFNGLVNWVQSDSAIPVISALGTLATMVWGQIVLLRKKKEAITMASALPDEVAKVVNVKPS